MKAAAFDADVLVYAAVIGHPQGRRISSILRNADLDRHGSVLLLPETLSRPRREGAPEFVRLQRILGALTLHPADLETALLAVELGSRYRLRAADATHLATAVVAGADTFLTDNRKDFPKSIAEIDVLYPDDLPDP